MDREVVEEIKEEEETSEYRTVRLKKAPADQGAEPSTRQVEIDVMHVM